MAYDPKKGNQVPKRTVDDGGYETVSPINRNNGGEAHTAITDPPVEDKNTRDQRNLAKPGGKTSGFQKARK